MADTFETGRWYWDRRTHKALSPRHVDETAVVSVSPETESTGRVPLTGLRSEESGLGTDGVRTGRGVHRPRFDSVRRASWPSTEVTTAPTTVVKATAKPKMTGLNSAWITGSVP